MANVSYKSLYTLVREEIEKSKSPANQTDSSSRSLAIKDSTPFADTNTIANSVASILELTIPSRIRTGLHVTATEPISSYITVEAGSGVVGSAIYELTEDVTIEVPFNTETDIFYVNLFSDGVKVERNFYANRVTVAKIIVPQPGITDTVRNTANNTPDAYIINMKEFKLLTNKFGELEEDSIELLRDNIGAILADNLIGNLRLSEDLKIINTQGTLELNSDSLKLFKDGQLIAKFNRNGTFYYDDNGIELARFTTEDARIGNMLLTKNSIGSNNYQSNVKGFRIHDDGFAEFEDVKIRGKISSSVFEVDKVSAVGGEVIVSNSSTLAIDTKPSHTTIVTEDNVFSIGEILKIKIGGNVEYMEVTDDSQEPIYTVTRGLNIASGIDLPTWNKGTAIISTGVESGGYVDIVANDNYSPYIDIVTRNSSTYNDISTKARLGNLSGITDEIYGTLDGYGLYSDNVYLKGKLRAPDIATAETGARIELVESGLFMYNESGSETLQAILEGESGGETGDFILGNIDGGNYLMWDNSAGSLKVRGDITAGGGGDANSLYTSETGARTEIDSQGLRVYNAESGGELVFDVDADGAGTGDVTMGNKSNGKYLKWDDTNGIFNLLGSMFIGSSANQNVVIDGETESIKVFGDTVTIDNNNGTIEWKENSTTYSATIPNGDYTPANLAQELEDAMTESGGTTVTVTYSSTTRKITFDGSSLTTFELLWNSGSNAEYTCAYACGFDPSSDSTGALTYTARWQTALRMEMGKLS